MKRTEFLPDARIVELFWQRSESAIRETAAKYGGYCHSIAYRILANREDAEESVSDTWLGAWNAMPPHSPGILSTFLGKLTRRIAVDLWRRRTADKRGGGEMPLVLSELCEVVESSEDVESAIEHQEMARLMAEFTDALPPAERRVFLCRYWYMESVADIAARMGFSVSKTSSMLHRIRDKLRTKLESEGYL